MANWSSGGAPARPVVGGAQRVRRGEVWWVDLGEPRGSAPALRRPAVVLQADLLNASRLATVVVAAMSSNLTLAMQPGNVVVGAKLCGLGQESVVNVTQIATLDRSNLVERAGALPAGLLAKVEQGVRVTLGFG